MRRICLYLMASFIFFCFSFGICPKIMAYDAPTSLPFTYAGYTFTDYIADNGGSIMYYNSSGSLPYTFSCAHGPDYGLPENIYYGWGVASPALLYYYGCTDFKNCSTVNIYTDSNSHCFGGVYFNSQDIYAYPPNNNVLVFQANPYSFTSLLTVNLNPASGGTVASSPGSLTCLGNTCTGSFSGNISVATSVNSGYQFLDWYENGSIITNNCPATTLNLTMSTARTISAKFIPEATDFVFPVLKAGVTDPLQNKANPIGNGWHGSGVGEQSADIGHLGQDYVMDSNNGDGDAAGEPVYAIANGIIVEITNNPNTQYGWCDSNHHGWGPIVVVKHVKASGFNTTSSIVTSTCGTETTPTVVYSLYGHLKRSSIESLHVGDIVTKGQQLGLIGDYYATPSEQPWSTNHLHFELKDEAGFNEGTWYESNSGQCPGSTAYTPCTGVTVNGVGTAYSNASSFAPHRYVPGIFITATGNQQ